MIFCNFRDLVTANITVSSFGCYYGAWQRCFFRRPTIFFIIIDLCRLGEQSCIGPLQRTERAANERYMLYLVWSSCLGSWVSPLVV